MEKRAVQVIRREREMLGQEEEASCEGGQAGAAEQRQGLGSASHLTQKALCLQEGSLDAACQLCPLLAPLSMTQHHL